jgi:predicted CXXCH cytochrome family protein
MTLANIKFEMFMSGHNECPPILKTMVSGGRKMKKVLVLLLVGALLATPAFAVIRNSKHDLSASSTATVKAGSGDETCVYCHTPHGGSTVTLAPLWNRSIPGGGFVAGDLYNSATLDQTNSNPTNVLTAVNNSDAPLCFSCHDGGTLVGGLTNPSNADGQPSGGNLAAGVTNFMDLDASGEGLTNDHPIGMNYDAVQGDDNLGFNAVTDSTNIDGLPLYTNSAISATSVMWCSTCHDVHDNSNEPFLNMTNVGSALCTTCHIK